MKVILRSDGNEEIGYGHLSRLNSFADILGDEYEKIFLTKEDTNVAIIDKNVKIELISKGLTIDEEVNWIADNFNPTNHIIIADGYHFNSRYQKLIKKNGYKLIYVDDMLSSYMYADCVINHAIGVTKKQYFGEKYVCYYLGSKYALLRSSFLKASTSTIERNINFQVAFVSFGGTDSSMIIKNAVNALLDFKRFTTINVVVGKSFNNLGIINFLKENKKVKLFIDINEETICRIMKASDFAIVPSSTISYELASSRCIIASGYTTQNQFYIYEGLRKQNIIFEMGDISNFEEKDFYSQIEKVLSTSVSEIQNKIKNQIKLFDGKQKDRLIEIIESLIKPN
tara:strand:- start:133 stop:1155 length:1023 start_codon:yes stop_codon:yes gene_type:complete